MQTEAPLLQNVMSGGIPTKVIALGIGNNIDEDELKIIASDPDDKTVILVDDFNSLSTVEEQLKVEICGRRSSLFSK